MENETMVSKGGLSAAYTDKWEQRASIRTRPGKFIDFTIPGAFFPEENQPIFLADMMSGMDNERKSKILTQSLFKYLNDIVNLEIKLINSACNKIIYGDLAVKFDEQIKLNAYTVIIDEYYHVYIARHMINQLREHDADLGALSYPDSDAYVAVTEVMKRLPERCHDIFEIIAVCIFETTLVRELVEFFNSDGVHPSIKYYVNDHMNDESRHYIFFLELLGYIWTRLDENDQAMIGGQIADFVKMYLNVESEKQFNIELLSKITHDREASRESINKVYRGFEVTPDVPIVKNVLMALKRTGILNSPIVRQGFENIGWII